MIYPPPAEAARTPLAVRKTIVPSDAFCIMKHSSEHATAPWPPPGDDLPRTTMGLSASELARLDVMLEVTQLQSDPPVLSETDRAVDALRAVSAAKRARPTTLVDHAPSRPAMPDERVHQSQWNAHRTLDELIEIRRALMRDEQ